MTLKINGMYKVDGGFIIPRSHIFQNKGDAFCIVEVLQGGENHFVKKHTTFNRKELRKVLGLGKGEKVEILCLNLMFQQKDAATCLQLRKQAESAETQKL